jgi:hypothetical protein
MRAGYGRGSYRRRILLRAESRRVTGDLEDDFHRFRVHVEHDGERIVRAEGEALRFPWTSCPGALVPLARLEGMGLLPSSRAAHEHTDPRAQCTHLFDLAGLAIASAARGTGTREYEIEVPDRVEARTRAVLRRDGQPFLHWEIERSRIVAPEPFEGRSMGAGFLAWVQQALEPDVAEAALVLHRTCSISLGRLYDMDAVEGPSAFGVMAGGACYTFSPGTMEQARRVVASARDVSRSPEALLADD